MYNYIIPTISLIMGLTTITAQLNNSLVVLNDLKGSGALSLLFIGTVGLAVASALRHVKFADKRIANYLALTQVVLGIGAFVLIGAGLYSYNIYIPPRIIAAQELQARLEAERTARIKEQEEGKKKAEQRAKLMAERVNQVVEAGGVAAEKVNEVYKGLSAGSKLIIAVCIATGLSIVLMGIYVDSGGGGGGLKSVAKTILAMGTAGLAGFVGGGPAGAVAAAGAAAGGASAWYSINWYWVAMGIGLVVIGLALWWYWGPIAAAVAAHKASVSAAGGVVAKKVGEKVADDVIDRSSKYGGRLAEGAIGLAMCVVGWGWTQCVKAFRRDREPPLND